ncbi:MAG: universal stress protein [Bacteroidia bacterium]|nr:universal stress protein [Bacteroidia bacterium]
MTNSQSNRVLKNISEERRIHHILVPIDFSEAAHNAFEYALHIAEMLNARLSVLHVYQDVHANLSYIPAQFVSALREEKLDKAHALLDRYLEEARSDLGKSVRASSSLRSGHAASEIVKFAKEQNTDMIIMGTQGANSPSEQILGSIAARVIQRCKCCPVLAIPSTTSFRPIRKIMYALSLEDNDAESVEELINFSSAMKSSLICTTVKAENSNWAMLEKGFIEQLENWENEGKLTLSIQETRDIIDGLRAFMDANRIDIIAMKTHSERASFQERSQSLTRKILMDVRVPVLAFQKED